MLGCEVKMKLFVISAFMFMLARCGDKEYATVESTLKSIETLNSSPTRKTRGSQKEVPKQCLPGQSFRMDCNTCLCDNEGQQFSCTRNDCRAENSGRRRRREASPPLWPGRISVAVPAVPPLLPGFLNFGTLETNQRRLRREVAEQEVSHCEPGSAFDIGCNVCRCADDGKHATCTTRGCNTDTSDDKDADLPKSESDFRCNPGEQFRRGCKDCTCSADGKGFFCTLRLCEKDLIPKF